VTVPPARRAAIRRRLLSWYDAGHRRLPWRFPQGEADPYRVWLSEVMLQQTQVAVALPYYRRFVERWPTLGALAAAPDDEVLAAWAGLGYYARCRNLLAAARQALARHGRLPDSLEALRRLPGLGPYTAGAVASIAFGIRAPALDGNAARVLMRLFLVEGGPAKAATGRRLRALAGDLVPARRPGDFNQALIDLGATVCRRRSPQCARCPLAAQCLARLAGRERDIPPARAGRGRGHLRLACAVARRRQAILLGRRDGRGLFAGLWELPAVEVRRREGGAAALRHGLRALLGVGAEVGEELARVERTLTHRELSIAAHRCTLRGTPRAIGYGEVRWVGPDALARMGMATAMRKVLEAVLGTGDAEARWRP
jgi:A/G-specific adenine glycosylase